MKYNNDPENQLSLSIIDHLSQSDSNMSFFSYDHDDARVPLKLISVVVFQQWKI